MTCWNITEIIRRARTVGVIIELDGDGNLRLRAPNEPPEAMVQHLREHKEELVTFLRAKARAEEAERQMLPRQQKKRTPRRGASKPAPATTVLVPVPVLATRPSRRKP